MNAPEKIPGIPPGSQNPESLRALRANDLSGLRAPVVVDRVSDSVKLLVGLAAGFWACTPVDVIREVLEGLGRADAHLVLEELSEKQAFAMKYLKGLHPDLLRVVEDKCS